MAERYYGDAVWKISLLRVDDVLEKLAEACVERVKIDSAMDYSH